jgi:hypothetical protein
LIGADGAFAAAGGAFGTGGGGGAAPAVDGAAVDAGPWAPAPVYPRCRAYCFIASLIR